MVNTQYHNSFFLDTSYPQNYPYLTSYLHLHYYINLIRACDIAYQVMSLAANLMV